MRRPGRPAAGGTQGVTKDEIKIGIPLIDFNAIKDFVDYSFGDTEAISKVFVDYINKNGGIDGRKLVPFYKKYPPIPGGKPDPLSLCTSWTEDDKVFAVLGVFIDFTGQAQLCLTKEHKIIHIGHELDQPWIDDVARGLLLTPDRTKENVAAVLVNLLSSTGRLKGKTVGMLGDKNNESRVERRHRPGAEEGQGQDRIDAPSSTSPAPTPPRPRPSSTASSRSGRPRASTRSSWPATTCRRSSSPRTIKAGLPKAQLITDTDTALDQAKDEQEAGRNPNPYEGMLSGTGLTQSERWANKSPILQQCVDIYEKATGTTVPGPDERKTTSNGKQLNTDQAVTDFCGELFMFKAIAEKVGPDLTVKNWQKTVNSFGKIDLPPDQFASLCKGKYDAEDSFRLVAYDSSIGASGDWKKLTPVKDAGGGTCTKAAG